jgi:hypothetical protein
MKLVPAFFDRIATGSSGIVSTLGRALGSGVGWVIEGRHFRFVGEVSLYVEVGKFCYDQ